MTDFVAENMMFGLAVGYLGISYLALDACLGKVMQTHYRSYIDWQSTDDVKAASKELRSGWACGPFSGRAKKALLKDLDRRYQELLRK
jgi:hypothetical protein